MKSVIAALFLVLLSATAFATPNLISKKSVFASRGVQPTVGQEMIVTIEIFNVGSSPAYDVRLDDKWHVDYFAPVSGAAQTSWEVIPAGANVSHVIILVPKSSGYMETRRATVDYRETSNGEEIRSVSTSVQGLRIYEPNEVDWLSFGGSHIKEWSVFLVFASVTVLAPGLFYLSVQSQKDQIVKQD